MISRSIELKNLVNALREEVSRHQNEHWYALDEEPQHLLPLQRIALHEAKQALQLVENGTYGLCIDCDTTIPLARLRAKPASIRCIDCQHRLEASTAA